MDTLQRLIEQKNPPKPLGRMTRAESDSAFATACDDLVASIYDNSPNRKCDIAYGTCH